MFEPPQSFGCGQAGPDYFKRHDSPWLLLLGFMHRTHAPLAELPEDPAVRDHLADQLYQPHNQKFRSD
jgi:hypothetical protein